eukprot:TRINITY_DN1115_c0_g1_i2.p1 TRINITY_DN1115_c0_g1~~TRINITY_DN1115_c0_g1_i2.p1  ORF type:complete len:298 (+),score=2.05 TRINITY_DN1115_c0_g1_i2:376-1269(+)
MQAVLYFLDLLNPSQICIIFNERSECKDVRNLLRDLDSNGSRSHTQHIHTVFCPRAYSRVVIMCQSAIHPLELIGHNHHAVSTATNHKASSRAISLYCYSDLCSKIGIIASRICVGAVINDGDALSLQVLFQSFFVVKSCVIGSHMNNFEHCLLRICHFGRDEKLEFFNTNINVDYHRLIWFEIVEINTLVGNQIWSWFFTKRQITSTRMKEDSQKMDENPSSSSSVKSFSRLSPISSPISHLDVIGIIDLRDISNVLHFIHELPLQSPVLPDNQRESNHQTDNNHNTNHKVIVQTS